MCGVSYLEDLRQRKLIDSLAAVASPSIGGRYIPVVSPVHGGNMELRGGDPSRTMEAFVRMLTCLPVAWPQSLASAATLTAVLGGGGIDHGGKDAMITAAATASCVLQHFGPVGGDVMSIRALRGEGERLNATGITVITDGRHDAFPAHATNVHAAAAVAATGGDDDVGNTDDDELYFRVLALVVSAVGAVVGMAPMQVEPVLSQSDRFIFCTILLRATFYFKL